MAYICRAADLRCHLRLRRALGLILSLVRVQRFLKWTGASAGDGQRGVLGLPWAGGLLLHSEERQGSAALA